MTRIWILLSFIPLLLSTDGMSQTQFKVHDPVPPTPDAAKLAQFDLTPTNLYTGAHNLSIPLYNIPFDGASIPLTLSYHSSGIRANENASWVGLGWALSNGGGSISRTVQGMDDLLNEPGAVGYCYDSQVVPDGLTNPTSMGWNDPYWSYMHGNVDTEPDLFSYSFMNSSGSFVLSKKSQPSDVIQVIKTKTSTDKIVFNETSKVFTITTADGFRGIFSIKEYSVSASGSNGNGNWTACNSQFVDFEQTINSGGRTATTWYPSSIVSPSKKILNFAYSINAHGYSNYISIGSKSYGEINVINSVFPGQSSAAEDVNTQKCSRLISEHVYLSSISDPQTGLTVSFVKSDRNDIERLDPTVQPYADWATRIFSRRQGDQLTTILKPQKLDRITVVNSTSGSTLNLQIDFITSYFNPESAGSASAADLLRLKLDAVKVGVEKYAFDYNTGVPNKSTMGTDYWGYYNGKDNNLALTPVLTHFPPSEVFFDWAMSDNYYYQTDNRKANFNYGKAGLLTKVIYPTGGFAEYEYEGHQYKLAGKEHVAPGGSAFVSASGLTTNETKAFSVRGYGESNCGGPITVTLRTQCKDFYLGNNCGIAAGDVNTIAAELVNGSGQTIEFLRFDFQHGQGTSTYTKTITYNTGGGPYLAAGNYTLKTYGIKDGGGVTKYYGDASITYPSECSAATSSQIIDVQANQVTGGARIKSIVMKNYDNTVLMRRSFQYTSPDQGGAWSSGKLMTPLLVMGMQPNGGGSPPQYFFISGSAMNNGNAAQGSHIGYSYVREKFEDIQANVYGYRDHYFDNQENIISPWHYSNNRAQIATPDVTVKNGYVTMQSMFDLSRQQQRVQNTNVFTETGTINCLKISWIVNGAGVRSADFHTFYKKKIGSVRVTETITEEYFYDQAQSFSRTMKESRQYNGYDQVIKTTTKDGNNVIVSEAELKYPVDYTNTTSPVIQAMVSRNIIGQPIETKSTQLGVLVAAAAQKFKVVDEPDPQEPSGTFKRILIDKIYAFNKDLGSYSPSTDGETFSGSYEQRGQMKYDEHGNVTEVISTDGIPTSYIWGYNRNYMVAKITGVSRQEIDNVLGTNFHSGASSISTTAINQLKAAYPKSLITSYTYNPGVGPLTVTDPNGTTITYEYDPQGRLKFVRDHQNNIVKGYDYHYKTEGYFGNAQ